MNTCESCRYFIRGRFEREIPWELHSPVVVIPEDGDFGRCVNVKVGSDYVEGWIRGDAYAPRTTDSIFADCDENRGDLSVGKDFGCIHWDTPYAQITNPTNHFSHLERAIGSTP